MIREHLGFSFGVCSGALLVASIALILAYAVPEPFEEYHRSDVLVFLGVSSAVVALWLVWSVLLSLAIAGGVLMKRWLFGLLLPVICIFYLQFCPLGYLDDMEDFMLRKPAEQLHVSANRVLELIP